VSFAIVPLEDTPFNRAKSEIKWLEYSACRIPGIYSDLAAYHQKVAHGQTGLLVPNTRDGWFRAMKTLVEDRGLRHNLAERAQVAVLAQHTVERNARLWHEAYEALFALPIPPASAETATVPVVSIVIPTFNKLELTRQCLLALQENTPAGQSELIVVDNGSTDGSVDFCKRRKPRAPTGRQQLGESWFRQGLQPRCRAALGHYVVFLNNDTEVHRVGWSRWLRWLKPMPASLLWAADCFSPTPPFNTPGSPSAKWPGAIRSWRSILSTKPLLTCPQPTSVGSIKR